MSSLYKLRKKERNSRKSLIIDAAMELLAHKDVKDIRIRDIAWRVGVSPTAVYSYFPRRDDILTEALIRHMKAIEALLRENSPERRAPLDQLAFPVMEYLLDNPSVLQLMAMMITGHLQPGEASRHQLVQDHFFGILERAGSRIGIDGDHRRPVMHAICASFMGAAVSLADFSLRSEQELREHMHGLFSIISRVYSAALDRREFDPPASSRNPPPASALA
jgi:AcrR family transcriptional regulator